MTTLTLQLTDIMAERLRLLADAEGEDMNSYALATLEIALTADDEEIVDSALVAALQKATDDMDAGHFLTMNQVEKNARAALATRSAKTIK